MVLSSFLVLAWFRQSNYSQTYFQYTFSLVSSDAFYLRKVSHLSTGQKFNGVEESLGIEMDVKDDMTQVIKAKTKNALR